MNVKLPFNLKKKTNTEYCGCKTDYELWKKLEDHSLSSYLVWKYN